MFKSIQCLSRGVTDLLNLLYPPLCIGCGATTHPQVPLCLPCALEFDQPLPGEVWRHILDKVPEMGLAEANALWIFEKDGPVQRIHRELKYGNRPYYGMILGELIGRSLAPRLSRLPDLVIPIPLHRTRFLERGYNQSQSIAFGISKVLQVNTNETTLFRSKRTRSQTNLSIRARSSNISGAFTCRDSGIVAERHALLVDDVITTGATVSEAARVLIDAGAASVAAAALGFARV